MVDQTTRQVWVLEARLGTGDTLLVQSGVDRRRIRRPREPSEAIVRYVPELHWLKPADIVGNYPKEGQAALVVAIFKDAEPIFCRWWAEAAAWRCAHLAGVMRMVHVERFALLELPEVTDGD